MRIDPRRGRQGGALLLEVLVSLVVVGIGVLGLIGMQARALSNQRDSFDRKAAAELLSQINERMRANHLGFMANAYSLTWWPSTPVGNPVTCLSGAPCSPANLAQNDLVAWQQAIRQRLVDGGAVIAAAGPAGTQIGTGASSMRVTMIWREAVPTQASDANCAAIGYQDSNYHCLTAEVFP